MSNVTDRLTSPHHTIMSLTKPPLSYHLITPGLLEVQVWGYCVKLRVGEDLDWEKWLEPLKNDLLAYKHRYPQSSDWELLVLALLELAQKYYSPNWLPQGVLKTASGYSPQGEDCRDHDRPQVTALETNPQDDPGVRDAPDKDLSLPEKDLSHRRPLAGWNWPLELKALMDWVEFQKNRWILIPAVVGELKSVDAQPLDSAVDSLEASLPVGPVSTHS